jgi:hypothetical protein
MRPYDRILTRDKKSKRGVTRDYNTSAPSCVSTRSKSSFIDVIWVTVPNSNSEVEKLRLIFNLRTKLNKYTQTAPSDWRC